MPERKASFPACGPASWTGRHPSYKGGGSSGPTGWPVTLFGSDLLAWWDFSDASTLYQAADLTNPVSADGQTILSVSDKSGNDVTLSHATAGPTYKTGIQNGLSVARFAATDLLDGTLSQAAPFTIFATLSCSGSNEQRVVAVAAGEGLFFDPAGGDLSLNLGLKIEGTVDAPEDFAVYTVLGHGGSSLTRQAGVQDASGDAGAGGIDQIRLGADTDDSGPFAGDIGEIVIVAGDQTANFASAESTLDTKWIPVSVVSAGAGWTSGGYGAVDPLPVLTFRGPRSRQGVVQAISSSLVIDAPVASRMAPAVVTAYVDIGAIDEDLARLTWVESTAHAGEYYAQTPTRSGQSISSILQLREKKDAINLTDGTYKWTLSGSGTNEYYMEMAAGGEPDIFQNNVWYMSPDETLYVNSNNIDRSDGRVGALVSDPVGQNPNGTWGWDDNDSLGFNTLYVRLPDGTDPDTKASGYITAQMWEPYTAGTPGSLGATEYSLGDHDSLGYDTLYVSFSPSVYETHHLDYMVGTTGTANGTDWEKCRIQWGVSGGSWVSSVHQNVTDPRTAASIDFETVGSLQGFSAAWVLGAGTWTITCRITNANGAQTTLTDTVVVAADTRTEYVVDSGAGGDYLTLAAAVSARGATDNVLYTIEDGHTETVSASIEVSGDNAMIAARGTGSEPVFSSALNDEWLTFASGSEGFILQGVTFTPTADLSSNVVIRSSGSFWGVVDCHFNGGWGGGSNRCAGLIKGGGSNSEIQGSHNLSLNCTASGGTRTYSWFLDNKSSGSAFESYLCSNVTGCQFVASENESIVRVTGLPHYVNVTYCDLDFSLDASPKSCLRLIAALNSNRKGYALHAWRNTLVNGLDWFGSDKTSIYRVSSNLLSYPDTGNPGRAGGGERCAFVSNVVLNAAFGHGACYGPWDQSNYAMWCCNTVYYTANSNDGFSFFTNPADNNAGSSVRGNLVLDDGVGTVVRFMDCGVYGLGITDIGDNVCGSTPTEWGVVDNTTYTTLANWNASGFTDGDSEVATTLNGSYVPNPATGVTLPAGVIDDYTGSDRSATTTAGAVEV